MGTLVVYIDSGGEAMKAEIVAVHQGGIEDPTPYYTISLEEGAGERETERSQLQLLPAGFEGARAQLVQKRAAASTAEAETRAAAEAAQQARTNHLAAIDKLASTRQAMVRAREAAEAAAEERTEAEFAANSTAHTSKQAGMELALAEKAFAIVIGNPVEGDDALSADGELPRTSLACTLTSLLWSLLKLTPLSLSLPLQGPVQDVIMPQRDDSADFMRAANAVGAFDVDGLTSDWYTPEALDALLELIGDVQYQINSTIGDAGTEAMQRGAWRYDEWVTLGASSAGERSPLLDPNSYPPPQFSPPTAPLCLAINNLPCRRVRESLLGAHAAQPFWSNI